LSAWGRLVVEVGASGAAPSLEQVIGGLVEWMGNELMDGWLHLPIPVFETASGLAEELFQVSQAYLAAVRAAGGVLPDAERAVHEARIRGVLERVDGLEAGAAAEDRAQGLGAGETA